MTSIGVNGPAGYSGLPWQLWSARRTEKVHRLDRGKHTYVSRENLVHIHNRFPKAKRVLRSFTCWAAKPSDVPGQFQRRLV